MNPEQRVIVIEPTTPLETRKLRVAAYVRVSSDSTDQLNSFMAQANYYTTLIAAKEHWELADLYADESVTGTSAEKRPEFQRMLEDCRQGRVDKILTKSVSRFARNAKECLETVRELKALGISVHFEEQGIDSAKVTGELLTSIFASLAQTESESISGNMRWSYRKRMEAGTFVPPCLPYGYRREKGRIVREPAEAAVVCRIFEAFLAGASSVEIASELTADRIPCRFGKGRWHSTVVRQILSNEKYTGNSLWQKYYTTEHLPFRKCRNHGEREQFYAVDTHEALISPETFQAAQQRLLCQRQRTGGAAREESVFRKKIRCACGGRMRRKRVRQIDYWVCVAHDEGGDCPLTQIPESQVQEAFLCLFHRLKHGTALLGQLLVELRAVQERAVSCHPDIALLNQQIADCKDQRRMLAEMNRVGLIDADLYLTQNNQIAAQLHKVKEQKRRILAQHHDDTLSKTEALIELLETMPDFLSEFDDEIFAEIVSRITVESNTALRFHLINGLELTESIERTRRP